MRHKTTANYFSKIRAIIPSNKFEIIEENLIELNNDLLESLWNIVSAGYTVEFAILNCINLYEYVQDKQVDYWEAMRTVYSIYPGLNSGIYLKESEWFELN